MRDNVGDTSGNVRWLHGDPTGTFRNLGSASMTTDANGVKTSEYRYTPPELVEG